MFRLVHRAQPLGNTPIPMTNLQVIATSDKNDAVSSPANKKEIDVYAMLEKAKKKALAGGLAGALSMVINVLGLMWLRTTINYQYRYGTSTGDAFRHLYKEGGIPRFYRGLLPALMQGPLSRFGDTAANTGMLALFEASDDLNALPVLVKTVSASVAAACFRIFLMPIDTVKTTMQVEGKNGLSKLMSKFRTNGIPTFYQGALAASSATFVGHYPWFATNNLLEEKLPQTDDFMGKLGRRAFIGFCSSAVSDTCSNSIRVIKVYKQASVEFISYPNAARAVIATDGVAGLFGRGLKTKILANGFQGVMFSIVWKYIMDIMK
jgi:hypothetical protein